MKLKYFIRGLGVGIVFTALILGIILKVPEKEQLTNAEIEIKASELGMVFLSDMKEADIAEPEPQDTTEADIAEPEPKDTTETDIAEPEPKDTTEPDIAEPEPKDTTETDIAEPEPEDTAGADIPDKVKAEDATAPDIDNKEEPKMISFSITKGMYSSRAAKEIQKVGLVEDSKDFEDYLVENNYQSRIMVGDYKINIGATYKQIAEIITK